MLESDARCNLSRDQVKHGVWWGIKNKKKKEPSVLAFPGCNPAQNAVVYKTPKSPNKWDERLLLCCL